MNRRGFLGSILAAAAAPAIVRADSLMRIRPITEDVIYEIRPIDSPFISMFDSPTFTGELIYSTHGGIYTMRNGRWELKQLHR